MSTTRHSPNRRSFRHHPCPKLAVDVLTSHGRRAGERENGRSIDGLLVADVPGVRIHPSQAHMEDRVEIVVRRVKCERMQTHRRLSWWWNGSNLELLGLPDLSSLQRTPFSRTHLPLRRRIQNISQPTVNTVGVFDVLGQYIVEYLIYSPK
jgi:hypothetical protein